MVFLFRSHLNTRRRSRRKKRRRRRRKRRSDTTTTTIIAITVTAAGRIRCKTALWRTRSLCQSVSIQPANQRRPLCVIKCFVNALYLLLIQPPSRFSPCPTTLCWPRTPTSRWWVWCGDDSIYLCSLHQREDQAVIEIQWSWDTTVVFIKVTHCFKWFRSLVYEWCIVPCVSACMFKDEGWCWSGNHRNRTTVIATNLLWCRL